MNDRSKALVDLLAAKFADVVVPSASLGDDVIVTVEPSKWLDVAKWLASEGGFSFLSNLSAVDWLARQPRFEIVYNLTDFSTPQRLMVKLAVENGDPPTAPSVTAIWPTANFHEREAFDMFGIVFDSHPNLERILLPDEWEGHPLRKDYSIGKVPIEFKHLSPGA